MTVAADPHPDEAFVRNPDVLESAVDDLVVALDISSGNCFSFGGPSRRIWDLLESSASASELSRHLVGEFEIEHAACLRETLEYLAKLESEGLVHRAPAS